MREGAHGADARSTRVETHEGTVQHTEPSHGRRVLSRRQVLTWLAASGLGIVLGRGALSVYTHRIEHVTAALPGLRSPMRAAWLCDMHVGAFVRGGSVERWIDDTIDLGPDVVLLGGDLVDALVPSDHAGLLTQLSRLHAPLGVYAVWGNHDTVRFRGQRARFERELAAHGVNVLQNRGVRVRDDLFIAGLDDLRTGRPDLSAALEERPAQGACVLLSHNPDVLPDVPVDVGLTLCGHTHGGQVRLPWLGPIRTSSRYGQRFASGWVEGPARGYVSRGLGVTQVPLRINCPPELTALRLEPG